MALRVRFWIGTALASASCLLCIVTLAYPRWIEAILGVDPDAGSGSAEWGIVLVLAGLTIAFAAWARSVRRQLLHA